MKAPIETIRLSEIEKDMLSKIKRKTSIESWNVICRWALAAGLTSNPKYLSKSQEKLGAIEIRWETFAGRWSDMIIATIYAAHRNYCRNHSMLPVADFFQMTLARGIKIISKQASVYEFRAFAILIKSESIDLPVE